MLMSLVISGRSATGIGWKLRRTPSKYSTYGLHCPVMKLITWPEEAYDWLLSRAILSYLSMCALECCEEAIAMIHSSSYSYCTGLGLV